jgi:hypothetical protein
LAVRPTATPHQGDLEELAMAATPGVQEIDHPAALPRSSRCPLSNGSASATVWKIGCIVIDERCAEVYQHIPVELGLEQWGGKARPQL